MQWDALIRLLSTLCTLLKPSCLPSSLLVIASLSSSISRVRGWIIRRRICMATRLPLPSYNLTNTILFSFIFTDNKKIFLWVKKKKKVNFLSQCHCYKKYIIYVGNNFSYLKNNYIDSTDQLCLIVYTYITLSYISLSDQFHFVKVTWSLVWVLRLLSKYRYSIRPVGKYWASTDTSSVHE